MKILIITADPKTLVFHRGDLLRAFADRGWEVVAAAGGEAPESTRFLEEMGGRYEPLRMARASMNPLRDLSTIRDLWSLIKREKPDIVFSYTIKSVIYGTTIASMLGVKAIFPLICGLGYSFTPDGTFKQRLISIASTWLYRLSLRRASKVFLQNHDDEELLRSRRILPDYVPSHVTAGSGVDLIGFAHDDLAKNEAFRRDKFEFVLVSRLLVSKGVRDYAEAARVLRKGDPEMRFHLVGPSDPGPLGIPDDEVRQWVDDGILEYHGSQEDVRPWLRCAHAFVLPTTYREGVPRSILEALAIGRPIVTTDAVGSRETVELTEEGNRLRSDKAAVMPGVNGFLFRPGDSDALVEALHKLIVDKDQMIRMGAASRRLAESVFDVRNVTARIIEEMIGVLGALRDKPGEAKSERQLAQEGMSNFSVSSPVPTPVPNRVTLPSIHSNEQGHATE